MKRALLILTVIVGSVFSTQAQVTSITVETFYTDDGLVPGYPAGHSTYRIYANTTNATDRITTVSGDANYPLVINVSGQGIWNSPNGGEAGDDVACSFYDILPILEYDSYMTIGYSCDNDGSTQGVYQLEDGNFPWQTELFATAPYGAGGVVVNSVIGATWFLLTDNINSVPVNNQVLLGQITTDGEVCGIFNLQVFPNYAGPGSSYVNQTGLEFGNCGTPGCIDPTALNYDVDADYDNGLCISACNLTFETVNAVGPTCAGDDDGSIQVIGAGNQSFINYTFDADDLGLAGSNGITQTGLSNGTYTITMHDTRFDNPSLNPGNIYGNCTVSEDVPLNTLPLIMTSSTTTDVTCNGDGDGCVNTTLSNYGGGTGALSFMIYTSANNPVQDGNGNDLVIPTPDYCGLGGGTFYFVEMDENDCMATGNDVTVVNPGALNLFEGFETAASCFNSSDATQVLTWGGGTGDVDFSAEDDDIYEIEGNPANLILTDLTAGSNMIYAQDENGCMASLSFSVAGGPVISINPELVQPLCFDDQNGEINIMAGGGTGTLSFSFDCVNFSSDADSTSLADGVYTVCVKDANDCIASLDVTLVEPEALTATASSTNITCNGDGDGAISVSPAGGTAIYAFSNDGGTTYSPSPDFSNLEANSYDIYVMDANSCLFILADAVEVTEPEVLTSSATGTNVSCNDACDGELLLTTSGGTGTYSYSLNDGPASSANPAAGLCADDYTVLVVDESGCEITIAATTITEPEVLVINDLTAVPISGTPGGNSTYTVTGGTEPYSFEWVNGANEVVSTTQNLPALTGADDDGTYTVTITDDNGCTVTGSIMVTGVGELGEHYSISLYPNPNTGEFVINIIGLKGEKMNYTIVDANGRVVFAKELGNVNGTRIESVNLNDAAAGIYNIQFLMGEEVHSMRFVKN